MHAAACSGRECRQQCRVLMRETRASFSHCTHKYLGITRPLTYPVRQNGKCMAKMILCVWLLSASITLPPLFGWAQNVNDDKVCLISQDFGYTIYSTAVAFYIPMSVMLFMYYRIFKAAKRSAAKHKFSGFPRSEESDGMIAANGVVKIHKESEDCTNLSKLLRNDRKNISIFKREQKAATTLGIIVGAFTICWLPFFILSTARPFICGTECSCIPLWMERTFLWLGYANSLINPFIYAFFNRDLRTTYRNLLQCRLTNPPSARTVSCGNSPVSDPGTEALAQAYLVCPVEGRAKYCSAQAQRKVRVARRMRTAVLCTTLNRADKVRLRRSRKTRRGRHPMKMGGPGPDRDAHRTGLQRKRPWNHFFIFRSVNEPQNLLCKYTQYPICGDKPLFGRTAELGREGVPFDFFNAELAGIEIGCHVAFGEPLMFLKSGNPPQVTSFWKVDPLPNLPRFVHVNWRARQTEKETILWKNARVSHSPSIMQADQVEHVRASKVLDSMLSIPIPQVLGIGRYLRYRNSDTEFRYFPRIGYRNRKFPEFKLHAAANEE
ncbi:unnamed protein product [Ranitomeya imitator]|uniref:5-hydroxytryptamine receptor 7 n=1 Tax=Ranitomeya imitator TaxID=111125 RepID=A0ABN9LDQ9_9NEOB|nr:unnamed protein product [Ranitomeya imitator]